MARLCVRSIRTDFMLKRPVAKFHEKRKENKWRSTILIKLEFVRVKLHFNVCAKRKHRSMESGEDTAFNKPQDEKHVFTWICFSSSYSPYSY